MDEIKHVSRKAGLPPGELVHIGNHKDQVLRMRLLRYNETDWQEQALNSIGEIPEETSGKITWLNIEGLGNIDVIKEVGERYRLHPLLLEDILNTRQRPKFEEFDNYVYIVFKILGYNQRKDKIETEQVSVVIGPDYVISFQEKSSDIFNAIRDRIRSGKGRIRKMRADFLAYSLMDTAIDHYFVPLEILFEKIDALQHRILLRPDNDPPKNIHELRKDMLVLRKAAWPTRQLIEQMQKTDSDFISDGLTLYLRDALDHTVRLTEAVDSIQIMLSNAMETYLSLTNQKTNQVMRFLTVVSTIFLPLTFICGVYGMNFVYMPELRWKYSYPILWVILIGCGVGMYYYFRRKKWF